MNQFYIPDPAPTPAPKKKSHVPERRRVDLTKTVVEAKLPIEFDGSSWTAHFLPTCIVFRRARSKQPPLIAEYETVIQRTIKADVEAARRDRRAKRNARGTR